MTAFASSALFPFTLAAMVMGGLVLVEVLSLLIGHSASGFVDSMLGHDAVPDADIDATSDLSPAGLLSWLNVGQVPFLILLILALAAFSVIGFGLQGIAAAFGGPLPSIITVPTAVVASVPVLRVMTRALARVIPRDESYAITAEDLVGSIGEVTLGPLDTGLPGQVRVVDRHGNAHFVRARAAAGEAAMSQGERVLLVERSDTVFLAMPIPAELQPISR